MLDLVKQETERIDSRFLEPACGDGNFLAEILRRKLAAVKSRYGKNAADYERYAVIALTSIYGVDILIDLSGGVCYFLWDRDNRGDCKVTSVRGDNQTVMERPLLATGDDTFVRFNEAVSILEKVRTKGFKSFADDISSRKPFGLPTNVKVKSTRKSGDIKIFAYPKSGYISRANVEKGADIIDKSKVLISYVYGERGDFPYLVIGKPFIGEIGTCCSETYLVARVCASVAEANNVISYMTTKLFRFLVLINKNTQHATSKVYQFVPLQDFSESWTDEKLYAKYGITEDEIAFIESMIRPMELGGGDDE
jgi:site-specific DNA-methyltransferase (adenine-specific)